MSLSNEQKVILKYKLTRKLVESSIASLSWTDIQSGIDGLSSDDKDKIVKALAGSGDNISALINARLRSYAEQAVIVEVDAIITQDFVPIELLYKVMQ